MRQSPAHPQQTSGRRTVCGVVHRLGLAEGQGQQPYSLSFGCAVSSDLDVCHRATVRVRLVSNAEDCSCWPAEKWLVPVLVVLLAASVGADTSYKKCRPTKSFLQQLHTSPCMWMHQQLETRRLLATPESVDDEDAESISLRILRSLSGARGRLRCSGAKCLGCQCLLSSPENCRRPAKCRIHVVWLSCSEFFRHPTSETQRLHSQQRR